MGKEGISPLGQHHPHVNSGKGSYLKSIHDLIGWQEIRRLYVKIMAGTGQPENNTLHHVMPFPYGMRGDYLSHRIAGILNFRKELRRRQQGTVHGIPVGQKGRLQTVYGLAGDPHVGISPLSPPQSVQVALGNVHASDETDLSVDDHYLAMVTVIDFAGETGKTDFQKALDLDSLTQHVVVKHRTDFPASDVVVEQAYLNTLSDFINQQVPKQPSHRIVFENIKLKMNMMAGLSYRPDQFRQHRMTVGKHIYLVSGKQQGRIYPVKEITQPVQFRPLEGSILLLESLHRTLAQSRIPFTGNQAFLSGTPPEEIIQEPSYYRQEKKDQNPCHRLDRIPIVQYHDENSYQNHRQIKYMEQSRKDFIYYSSIHTPFNYPIFNKFINFIPQKQTNLQSPTAFRPTITAYFQLICPFLWSKNT